jgi:hypothetical protein
VQESFLCEPDTPRRRQVARPTFTDADRTILAVLSQTLDRRRLSEVLLIV